MYVSMLAPRLLLCITSLTLSALPLAAQALPLPADHPERVIYSVATPACGTPQSASEHVTLGATGPLPVKQSHEGPEVFSLSVAMNLQIERYLSMYTTPQRLSWLKMILARGRPFFGYIASRIASYHLPPELLYLPIAESSYDTYAVSRAGAAGLWQLMPMTGKRRDLRMNRWVDQRFDFWTATDASLQTLKHDHRVLGNWLLALAAYDAGLNFMRHLVQRTGIHDFWTLAAKGYLPTETANYVPRFFALVAICSYPGRYGLPLSWDRPVIWDRIRLREPVDIHLLADVARVSEPLLSEANADLRRSVTPPAPQRYYLNVPKNDKRAVVRALTEPKNGLIQFYIYFVHKGDTLYRLSRHYGVPVSMILAYNPGVRAARLPTGRQLLIPAVENVAPYRHHVVPSSPAARRILQHLELQFTARYTVRAGDTLWSIAERFDVLPEQIAEVNGFSENALIRPGLVLRVPPGSHARFGAQAAADPRR